MNPSNPQSGISEYWFVELTPEERLFILINPSGSFLSSNVYTCHADPSYCWINGIPDPVWTKNIIPFLGIKDLSLASAAASHFEAYWMKFKNAKVNYNISFILFIVQF